MREPWQGKRGILVEDGNGLERKYLCEIFLLFASIILGGGDMRYRQVPKRLLEETMAIIRLQQFLRYECGLKFAEGLKVKELKELLNVIKTKKKLK